jgi:hypothetical protein
VETLKGRTVTTRYRVNNFAVLNEFGRRTGTVGERVTVIHDCVFSQSVTVTVNAVVVWRFTGAMAYVKTTTV